MKALFCRRGFCFCTKSFNHQFQLLQTKPFCNNTHKPTTTNNQIANVDNKVSDDSNSLTKFDPYKEVHNLDFAKATRILFSDPPKKKIFGLDFHLVQLFFACLPSLAVYLVALYARREMRIMDAELERKKKIEEEAIAKDRELKSAEEAAAVADNPEFVEVKERLLKLEETVKEFVVETKKQRSNSEDKSELGKSKKEPTPTKPNSSVDSKESSSASTSKTSSTASTQDLDSQK